MSRFTSAQAFWDAILPLLLLNPAQSYVFTSALRTLIRVQARGESRTVAMMLWQDDKGPLIACMSPKGMPCLIVARHDFGHEAAEFLVPDFILEYELYIEKIAGPSFAIDSLMAAFNFPFPKKNLQTIIQAEKIMFDGKGISGGLRKPSDKDAKLLFQMQSKYYEEHSGESVPDEFVAQTVMAHLRAGHYWLWEVDGKPVSLLGTMPAIKGFGAHIEMLYTDPAMRRKRFASTLIAEAAQDIFYCGAEFLSLQVFNEYLPAKSFFVSLGFREVGDYCYYE